MKQKYSQTISVLPNFIMDPVLPISKRNLVITNIYLPTVIKDMLTELSKEVWRVKDNGVEPSIKWSIVSAAPLYHCGGSRYNQCLAEKLAILSDNRKTLLNKRSKIVNTCRKKFKLKSIRLNGFL